MRKSFKTAVVATLALSLAVACGTGVTPSAAAKKPTIKKDTYTIYVGKSKTVTIKNVKAKNVKSLKVKAANQTSTKVGKKILNGKKVGFVLKSVGVGASDINVTLKLKKAQAGKKTYKFSLTTLTGSGDAPFAPNLYDEISEDTKLAVVLKAGAPDDSQDNALLVDMQNESEIGRKNISFEWFENGKMITDAFTDRFRPSTQNIVIDDPASASGSAAGVATGSAAGTATGTAVSLPASGSSVFSPMPPSSKNVDEVIETSYVVRVTNELSKKSTLTNPKLVRIIAQHYIDHAVKTFDEFAKKYPYKSAADLPDDSRQAITYMRSFIRMAHGVGICLGMTTYAVDWMYNDLTASSNDVAGFIKNEVTPLIKKASAVGSYLGIKKETVDNYINHLSFIVEKSVKNPAYSVHQLHYK